MQTNVLSPKTARDTLAGRILQAVRRPSIVDVRPEEDNRRPYALPPIVVAAKWNGSAVGRAVLRPLDDGQTAMVENVEVNPIWRSRGVGARLLRRVLARARMLLVQEVYVTATADTAGFFALHGFRPADEDVAARLDTKSGIDRPPADESPRLLYRRLSKSFINEPGAGITVKL